MDVMDALVVKMVFGLLFAIDAIIKQLATIA